MLGADLRHPATTLRTALGQSIPVESVVAAVTRCPGRLADRFRVRRLGQFAAGRVAHCTGLYGYATKPRPGRPRGDRPRDGRRSVGSTGVGVRRGRDRFRVGRVGGRCAAPGSVAARLVDRIMPNTNFIPRLTADEAAAMIPDGAMVGFSGFTPAGAAKAVPRALAARARRLHDRGQPLQVRVLTGASTGPALDDALAEADAISWRRPLSRQPADAGADQFAPDGVRRHAFVAPAADGGVRFLRQSRLCRRRSGRPDGRRAGVPERVGRRDADVSASRRQGDRGNQFATSARGWRRCTTSTFCRCRRTARTSRSSMRCRRSGRRSRPSIPPRSSASSRPTKRDGVAAFQRPR